MEEHFTEAQLVRLFSYAQGVTLAEVNRAIPHILDCPACWLQTAEVAAKLKQENNLEPVRRGRPPVSPYHDARLALLVLFEMKDRAILDSLEAKSWWAELKELGPREQAAKVHTVAATHRREVFETILREAKLACVKDPYAGEHLALSAFQLVDHLPITELSERAKAGLRLSAMTVVANSRRLAFDWNGSLAALNTAKGYLSAGEVAPGAQAYLLSIHASLAGDTGKLEESVQLARRAAVLYKKVGDFAGLAAVNIKEGLSLEYAGRAAEAVIVAEEALAVVPSDHYRLKMLARSLFTDCLIAVGRLHAALKNYGATKILYEQDRSETTPFQAQYLEAKLLDAFGNARGSEKLFRSAIAGATDLEVYRLSLVYRFTFFESLVRREALDKAARLCRETVDVLKETGAHAQMRQVWKDMQAAVAKQALTASDVAAVRDYLARHWAIPAAQAPLALSGELRA